MPFVRTLSLALAATLVATAAHADPFRISGKLSCFQPGINGANSALSKKVRTSNQIIAEVRGISELEAKQFDLVYAAQDDSLQIVTRCDGSQVDLLATRNGNATTMTAPVNGVRKLARTSLLLPEATWGSFATRGGIACRFFGKVTGPEVTALNGVCKAALFAFGTECEAQLATAGKFVPKGPCM
jgi:hypothetical protein